MYGYIDIQNHILCPYIRTNDFSIFCRYITKLQEQNVDKINKERQVTGEKRWVNILEQMVSVAKQTQI